MSVINKIQIGKNKDDLYDIGVDWSNVANHPTFMLASDIYDWAKASSKPTYTWNEITSKPTEFIPSSHVHDGRYYTKIEIDTILGDIETLLGAL